MPNLTGTEVTVLGVHYAPETTGNAPYTTALAQAIASAGAKVRVITGVPHYPQWKVSDPKYKRGLRWRERLDGIALTRIRHFVPAKPNLLGRAGLELTFFVQCLAVAARDRSDVLVAVTPTLSGLAAAILCRKGRPVGVLVQDLTGASAVESGTSSGQVGGLIARAEYWLLKRADRVGVITPRFGAVLTANGIDAAKVVQLPNFTHVTPVAATPREARQRLGWTEGFTVVHTGNMGMKQGLESVVQAAQLAAGRGLPLQFVLIGDGNQRRALEELAAGCANLRFVDPLDEADYPYGLAAADVLLVNERPGVREMSLPSKLTSYSVARRPIIAAVESDGITAETLNRHGAALLCGCGDPAALLDAVADVIASDEFSEQLVTHASELHRTQYGAQAAFHRYQEFVATLADHARAERSSMDSPALPSAEVTTRKGAAGDAAGKVTVLQTMKPPNGKTRYVDQITVGMPENVQIKYFTWMTALMGRYDVFHVHWPEFLARPSTGKNNGALKRILLRLLVIRLRLQRTVVVRTLHNIVPHERSSSAPGTAALTKLGQLTDCYIRLNESTESPTSALVHTIPLGHYIDAFAAYERLTVEQGRIVFFGLIRPYKGVDALVELLRNSSRAERLRIVGNPSTDQIRQTIEDACAADARISAILEFVSDEVLVREVSQSEIVVLPYREMGNSGVMLVALSLGRTVVAPRTPINALLDREVGAGWIVMYDGPISWTAIDEGLAAARSRPDGALPRLDARDWSSIRQRHADLYLYLHEVRSTAPGRRSVDAGTEKPAPSAPDNSVLPSSTTGADLHVLAGIGFAPVLDEASAQA